MSLETFLINAILPFFVGNFLPIALIGTILSGNLFVIFMSTLSGQGFFSFWKVLIISLIGTFISDFAWFNIGKTKLVDKVVKHPHFLFNYKRIKNTLDNSLEKSSFFLFLPSKFVYGTRILTLMHAGRKKMKIKEFIFYDFLSSSAWVLLLVVLGWLAGKGFDRFLNMFNSFRHALAIFVIIIFLLYVIWLLIGEVIITKIKSSGKIK